jgi:Spy/CpxP family protein refolding chaperone
VLRNLIVILLCSLGVTSLALAGEPAPSPYVGQELQPVKALSDAEVQDLLAGRGMGLAKAAELNRYPGPAHVLELADRLGLTPDQKARSEAVFKRMEADARDLGRDLVERETSLDRLFGSRRITRDALADTLEAIGRLQGQLRKVHLEAHLAQTDILTPEQIRRYDELRGYGAGAGHDPAAHKH